MAELDHPQIYLISPPHFDLSSFTSDLARVLDSSEIACFRLALASQDQDEISRAADATREVCHTRDVAIVIEKHSQLALQLGLDGVHLLDAAKSVRDVRKTLGGDAIVGTHCGTSKHAGMTAAEIGADYVAFGPVTPSALGDGAVVDTDVFQWWTEMVEVPVVAEGGITAQAAKSLAQCVDFLALGPEVWTGEDPTKALSEILTSIS